MDSIHIVHWKNSGIYVLASNLVLNLNRFEGDHRLIVLRHDRSRLDSILFIFRVFYVFFISLTRRKTILHAHSFLPTLCIFPASLKAITLHCSYPFFSRKQLKDKIKTRLFVLSTGNKALITSVGKHIADNLNDIFSKPLIIIKNAISKESHTEHTQKSMRNFPPIKFGIAGRLDPEKEVLTVVKTFSEMPHLHLLIAGTGLQQLEIENYIRENNVTNVELLGHIDNIQSFYNQLDAYICTSRYEGFGLAIAEAMLSELPIISTQVGIILDDHALKSIEIEISEASIRQGTEKLRQMNQTDISNMTIHNKNHIYKLYSDDRMTEDYYNAYLSEFRKYTHSK